MADPLTIDLFKFVAVRPPQLASDDETARSIIRDARADTPDGATLLARKGRALSTREAALAQWRNLALDELTALAKAHAVLVRHYTSLAPDAPTPDARALLGEAEARAVIDRNSGLLPRAWDALYVADATGSDAGPRLEVPIAALRVLHFATLVGGDALSPEDALVALRAVPAIPIALRNAMGATEFDVAGIATPASASTTTGVERVRALAHELHETDLLIDAVTRPPALPAPVATVHEAPAIRGARQAESRFELTTAPSLRALLEPRLIGGQAALLDRLRIAPTATLPAATMALQAHRENLASQAFSVANDRDFQKALREARGAVSIGANTMPTTVEGAKLDDPGTAPETSVAGRVVPLGVGDLKVVKETLLRYQPGEVAHIENVLKGETKKRTHRKLDRVETTVIESEEETRETERDTQSTERMELKRETAQTIKEDMSIQAGLTVTATFGPVVTTATGDFAYSTSKEDSVKSSSNFARDVVDRSVTKVQTKMRTERTTKTTSETEETNEHGVDNVGGAGHVTGVYRWVDKRYRAQVYNYGVRLLLEFVVPEPAAFWRAARLGKAANDVNADPPAPFVNLAGDPLSATDMVPGDHLKYGSKWGVTGLTPPPPEWTFVGTSIAKDSLDIGKTIGMATKELVAPEGYRLMYYSATISVVWVNHVKFTLQIGRDSYPILNVDPATAANIANEVRGSPTVVDLFTGSVPVSVAGYDVTAFAVNVQGICSRTPDAYAKWQATTYDKIRTAWQALQTAYEQKLAQAEAAAGFAIVGQNPAMNRVEERTELKKLCITMMTGQHFKQFDAMTDPADKPAHFPEIMITDALDEGRIVQFFEQAFEWEQMTYLFYPYFWGRKRNWVDVSRLSDPDPLFARFLTAGYARVVVPVPMAYADAVQFLLQSTAPELADRVWHGGPRPTIGNPLYISITEEMRRQTDDLAGAVAEGEPWEYTLPTTLVWLQPGPELPTFT
jgi:hypothetical protein